MISASLSRCVENSTICFSRERAPVVAVTAYAPAVVLAVAVSEALRAAEGFEIDIGHVTLVGRCRDCAGGG